MNNFVSWSKIVGVVGLVLGGLATLVGGYADMLDKEESKKTMEIEIRKEVSRQLALRDGKKG